MLPGGRGIFFCYLSVLSFSVPVMTPLAPTGLLFCLWLSIVLRGLMMWVVSSTVCQSSSCWGSEIPGLALLLSMKYRGERRNKYPCSAWKKVTCRTTGQVIVNFIEMKDMVALFKSSLLTNGQGLRSDRTAILVCVLQKQADAPLQQIWKWSLSQCWEFR